VITGASSVEQVVANFGALDVISKITPEVKVEIEAAVA
ncbi:MAG: aldo/keto reductase, partial [Acidimicrobiaceae bacterium]|nr:aldo/keto reductase [Acidimicrobiaceae bacterium]